MDTVIRPFPAAAHLRRPRASTRTRGQSTVEFALIILPFFAIFFALVDYAQIYFYENSLQNALREATRFATAGSVIPQTNAQGEVYATNNGVVVPKAILDSEGREASRYGCIRMWFQSNCVITIPATNIQVVSASALPGAPPVISTNSTTGYVTLMEASGTNSSDNAVAGPGNANDYVQVTATYALHTITPFCTFFGGYQRGKGINVYNVHLSAIVKNEPALLNFEHTNMYQDEAP
jgi:Flp pilus assembly protein TadG